MPPPHTFTARWLLLPVAVLTGWASGAGAQTAPVTARPADDLVESVGVNAHFDYPDTNYFLRIAEVRAALCALGVRHLRHGSQRDPSKQAALLSAVRECGLRVTVPMTPRTGPWPAPLDLRPEATERLIDAARDLTYADGTSAVEAFEGPNEYDVSHGDDPDWTGTLRQYQRTLHELVEDDPDFGDRPVLAPSFAYHQSTQQIASFPEAFDALNMHPYPGGGPPEPALVDNLASYRAWAPGVEDVVVTETGYHNALGDGTAPGGYIGQPGVPEKVEARYLPRLFLESLRQGVSRTFTYEVLDLFPNPANNHQEYHFGLLRNDATEKPAYWALQNTLALFADPGPPFEAGALALAVEGDPGDLRWLLFERRDGRFLLALWRNARSYETPAGWRSGEVGRTLNVWAAPVTVRLAAPAERVAVYLPSQSAEPVETTGAASAVDLGVRDEVVVVEITPARSTAASGAAGSLALLSSAGPSPNPSAGRTVVPFALSAPATVSLDVFDVLGRRVWAGRLDAGPGPGGRFALDTGDWASGTYLTRLTATAGGQAQTLAGRLTVR